jgi:HEAT repeat protein
LAERLKRVCDVQDADQRTSLVEHLIAALYVCGPESAAALLNCFPALDDYGKSLAAAVLGMLGAHESADTLWDFFNAIIEQPNENYFIGPLWGLVDLGDPRAADALARILGDGFFFFEAFAMAHRAADARLVLPLLYAMMHGGEEVLESARFALISIVHRIGREAMLDALAPLGRDGNLTDVHREKLADRILSYDLHWSEDYFASFFEGIDTSQVDPAEFRYRAEQLKQLEVSNSLRTPPRPGRNAPCWCGSGKKYKQCHLRHDQEQAR